MDNVGFDRTQGFVSDHHKDLLLFLQADEVPKPRLLSQSGSQTRKVDSVSKHMKPQKTFETKTNVQLYILRTSNIGVIICLKGLTQGLIQVLDWTCLLMWELKETIHSQNQNL